LRVDEYRALCHAYAYSGIELAPWEPHLDYADLRARALVPHWLTVIVSASDAVATCPRRLAAHVAGPLGLKLLKPPFETPPIRVFAARRRNYEDAGVDWMQDRLRDALGPAS